MIERIPIVLDTDIGDDIDDVWALAVCAKHPAIQLVGVTTVGAHAQIRAAIARSVLKRAGRQDVPVVAGTEFSSEGKRISAMPVYADIVNAQNAALCFDTPNVTEFIREIVGQHDSVSLVTIGPPTNIGLFFRRFPGFSTEIRQIYMMCGRFDCPSDEPEYNARCDPIAVKQILSLPMPKYIVGLDITLKCRMSNVFLDMVKQSKQPLAQFLYDATTLWQEKWQYTPMKTPIMHDVLAVLSIVEKELIEFRKEKVEIDQVGNFHLGIGRTHAYVAVDVDIDRVWEVLYKCVIENR